MKTITSVEVEPHTSHMSGAFSWKLRIETEEETFIRYDMSGDDYEEMLDYADSLLGRDFDEIY